MSNKPKLVTKEDPDGYGCDEYYIDWGDGQELELVFMDSWQQDCPEDLSWGRYISDVFYAGVQFGQKGGS